MFHARSQVRDPTRPAKVPPSYQSFQGLHFHGRSWPLPSGLFIKYKHVDIIYTYTYIYIYAVIGCWFHPVPQDIFLNSPFTVPLLGAGPAAPYMYIWCSTTSLLRFGRESLWTSLGQFAFVAGSRPPTPKVQGASQKDPWTLAISTRLLHWNSTAHTRTLWCSKPPRHDPLNERLNRQRMATVCGLGLCWINIMTK